MPRITKKLVADTIATRPFDPSHDGTPLAFAALAEELQAAVAAEIARDKANGLSGADLRAKFGGASKSEGAPRDTGLTGPMRRNVLRKFSLASTATIARSYDAYGDGTPRAGSAHARNYGPRAEERKVADRKAAEEAIAAAKKSAPAKAGTRKRAASKPAAPAKAARKPAAKRAPRKPRSKAQDAS